MNKWRVQKMAELDGSLEPEIKTQDKLQCEFFDTRRQLELEIKDQY